MICFPKRPKVKKKCVFGGDNLGRRISFHFFMKSADVFHGNIVVSLPCTANLYWAFIVQLHQCKK
jgi:hypothetical protein